eukprot:11779969-Alexandrium_andersonii.AAC.1
MALPVAPGRGGSTSSRLASLAAPGATPRTATPSGASWQGCSGRSPTPTRRPSLALPRRNSKRPSRTT